jgi:hypothetical protein
MAKTKISEFDVDPANNTDINSINIAEGCAPSGINNAIRQLMSDLKEFQTGAAGDGFTVAGAFAANGGATLGDASGDALTINSSAVSIPNGLNFDSNTLVIDATNDRVGVGTASPASTLDVSSATGIISRRAAATTEYVSIYADAAGPTVKLFGGTSGKNTNIIADADAISLQLIAQKATAPIIFSTNSTERMRIDSDGNVGIGTSSPDTTYKFTVAGTGGVAALVLNRTNTGLGGSKGIIGWKSLNNYYTACINEITDSGSDNGGGIVFRAMSSSTTTNPYTVTERMRIDSSGNVLFGKTSANVTNEGVYFEKGAIGYGRFNFVKGTASGTGATTTIGFYYNGTGVGSIQNTNTATSYITSSDYRLKENIAPMTGALATVQALKPVTYTWKVDGSDGQGFIAHELAEVVPDCVSGEKDAVETYLDEDGVEQTRPKYQGIDTSFLVATLTAAIQEQQAIITDLKSRIEALEA